MFMNQDFWSHLENEGAVGYGAWGNLISCLDAFPAGLMDGLIYQGWTWMILGRGVNFSNSLFFDGEESYVGMCDYANKRMGFCQDTLLASRAWADSVVFHEMAHAIHQDFLTLEDKIKLQDFFDTNKCRWGDLGYEVLMKNMFDNNSEYFSNCLFMYLTEEFIEIPCWNEIYVSASDFLAQRDPGMFEFIEEFLDRFYVEEIFINEFNE